VGFLVGEDSKSSSQSEEKADKELSFIFFRNVASLKGRVSRLYCLNWKFSSEIPFSEREKMIWLPFNAQNKTARIVNGEGAYIVLPLGRSLKINTIHLAAQF